MSLSELQPGDVLYATTAIHNDGGIPEIAADALLASPGSRGVLLNIGHLEAEPDTELYLVRFEDAGGELGPPVGCLAEELSVEQASHA